MNTRRLMRLVLAILPALAEVLLLAIVLSGFHRPLHAASATLYIAPPPLGNDGNPCSSSQPCATVQHAVDVADDGAEIRVATGTYTDTHTRSGHIQVLYLNKSVTVQGGYSTDFATRDPQAHPTTLNAGKLGRVVYVAGNFTPTLDGLRLTGGDISSNDGGGVYVEDAHPIINNCYIYSNTAGWGGGGVAFKSSTNATLRDSYIYSNTANSGGGVSADVSSDDITLSNNHIFNNIAQLQNGGGVYFYKSDGATLADNEIHDNQAFQLGGGIYLDSGDGARLTHNRVYSNMALHYGGGVFVEKAVVTFEGNTIQSNQASSEAGMGIKHSDATLINNLVADNVKMGAPCAAGILVQDSTATLIHNTIAHNRGFVPGSGVYVTGTSVVTLTNTILVSHTVGITVAAGSTATLKATLWGAGSWANETGWGGNGHIVSSTNVTGDPGFTGEDYHIGAGSAAIDQGAATSVTNDIDGDRRIGIPDLGADEYVVYVYLPLTLRNYQ